MERCRSAGLPADAWTGFKPFPAEAERHMVAGCLLLSARNIAACCAVYVKVSGIRLGTSTYVLVRVEKVRKMHDMSSGKCREIADLQASLWFC